MMMALLFPIKKDGVVWFTALYKCDRCGELTRRGETNQRHEWTTFVERINDEQAQVLIAEKQKRDQSKEDIHGTE